MKCHNIASAAICCKRAVIDMAEQGIDWYLTKENTVQEFPVTPNLYELRKQTIKI